jgi:cell division protease FtsH
MTSIFRRVLLWMGLLTVIFLAWHFAQIQQKEDSTLFSDFLARVDAGEVHWVRIDMRGQGPAATFRVRLKDGQQFRADGFYSDSVLGTLRAANVPFWTQTDETPAWANMLISWAPFLLLIGFWVFFMRSFKSGDSSLLGGARTAVAVRLDREEPSVFPVSLSGTAAATLRELVGLVKAEPPAAVLLTGPSGSGKTHLLRALTAELGSPTLLADAATFTELFAGVGAARVRDLFAEGHKQGAAFVAIEGLDEIGRRRTLDSRGERDERTQAMLQLAASLDALSAPTTTKRSSLLARKRPRPKPFAFVGVTNRPDLIDPALLQRFARVVTVGPPDREERASILADLLRAAGFPDGLDLNTAAARTEGWTRGDLRACADDVLRTAAGRAPTGADLDAALAARQRVRDFIDVQPA